MGRPKDHPNYIDNTELVKNMKIRLARIVDTCGIPRTRLAIMCGIETPRLYSILCPTYTHSNPTMRELVALCDALGITTDYALKGKAGEDMKLRVYKYAKVTPGKLIDYPKKQLVSFVDHSDDPVHLHDVDVDIYAELCYLRPLTIHQETDFGLNYEGTGYLVDPDKAVVKMWCSDRKVVTKK